ncbi:integrase, catalytic region, zinc finger, CCHC-type containing protein [Tanacetum coccineum]
MTKLSDENVLLKTQVQSIVQERENIKLEYQKLFNSVKATRVQHQQEVKKLVENVNQKTYAYGDVRAKNQDLLMTIFELKARLTEQAKNVNTKFDESTTLEKPVCVTPLNKNKDLKAKIVSKVEIKTDKSKPVTSCSTSKNEQDHKPNVNSKDTNSKKKVLLNAKSKSTSKDVKKLQSSSNLVANKNDTLNSNVFESRTIVLKAKTVNVVHDGSNLVCVSCGNDDFLTSHDKCVACYDLSSNSRLKRALFPSHVTAKSSKVGATPVFAKYRFSVATPLKATNKDSSASPITPEFRQSHTLSSYMKIKIRTSRKWQKWFEHQSSFNWSPKSLTTQTPPSDSKSSASRRTYSRTLIVLWIVDSGCSKHMTGNLKLLRNFVEKFMGTIRFGNDNFAAITGYGDYVQANLTICHVYYVEGLGQNILSVRQSCDGDLEVAFRSNTCYVRNLEGEDLLTSSRESNVYTISISDMASSSPVCLLSKATSTKLWLWHRRFSHLNIGTINQLSKNELVDGLSISKYDKDHLCSTCEQGKSKKATFPSKLVPSSNLNLNDFNGFCVGQ